MADYTGLRAQLQTDDPYSPGNALESLAKMWAKWRINKAAEPIDPTGLPFSVGSLGPLAGIGRGPHALSYRDFMRRWGGKDMPVQDELNRVTHDAQGNLSLHIPNSPDIDPVFMIPKGSAEAYTRVLASPTGGGSMHTIVPEKMGSLEDLAKKLLDYQLRFSPSDILPPRKP